MTKEEKQLLIKDLCARLPYGVDVEIKGRYDDGERYIRISTLDITMLEYIYDDEASIIPYLRPMSSMTEEECITLSTLMPYGIDAWKYIKTPIPLYIANIEQFDFFHRHHLDWRGLIQKGLALEAPEGMYNDF